MTSFSRAIEVAFTTNTVWASAGTIAIVMGILIGGGFAWSGLYELICYILFRSERDPVLVLEKLLPNKKRKWVPPSEKQLRHYIHYGRFLIDVVFFAGIVYIAFLGFGAIGTNPWQTAAMTIVVGAIVQYIFASPMTQLGAAESLRLEGYRLRPGMHLDIAMTGYDGILKRVTRLGVVLKRFDETSKSTEYVFIPHTTLINSPSKTNVRKENEARRVELMEDPRNDEAEADSRQRRATVGEQVYIDDDDEDGLDF